MDSRAGGLAIEWTAMTRTLLFLAASVAGTLSAQNASMAGGMAPAQATGSVITEAKASYNAIKGYLTRAVAAMPEENYSFKPTPEIRTFAALVAHIADHQTRFCSSSEGAAKQGDAASKTTKADLVAAMAASFTVCDAAWGALTDANMNDKEGQRTRFGWLLVDVMHSNEEYGYMSLYFRLKGLVPPSSDRGGR